jgi:5-methylcytosine-specific restriction endonuclease McrA
MPKPPFGQAVHKGRRGRPWRRLRAEILARDGNRCHYCGGPAATVDHLTPRSRGGDPTNRHNLVAACLGCNSAKGDLTEDEFAGGVQAPVRNATPGRTCAGAPCSCNPSRPLSAARSRHW